jgi:hypothetical protein
VKAEKKKQKKQQAKTGICRHADCFLFFAGLKKNK